MRALVFVLFLLAALACSADDDEPAPTPASSPPTDGTVDPLNPGSTNPFTVRANPDPPVGVSILADVRIGSHPENGGWDRIVFEFKDSLPAGEVEYQAQAIGCGSGERIPLPSSSVLTVRFIPAVAHDDAGRLTIRSIDLGGTGAAVLRARQTCDYEAEVAWAVAVSGRQPFKVTRLSNPTRLVIDIKQ